ncbi:MAG TPA: efflux RND transporter permease subunit, partial [Polyangiaceae bacterium]|nr:efflux RND transporter permease subunit [Polyangiaceae bacterium]
TQNLYLTPPDTRSRTQAEIYAQLSKGLSQFQDIRVSPSQPPTIGARAGGQPLQYVLQAPSAEKLLEVLPPFLDAANQRKELTFVDVDFKLNREEARVNIDRARAAQLGVDVANVARTLQLSFGDQRLGYYIQNGKQYQVISQLDRPFRNEPADLRSIFVKNEHSELVSLDNLISWEESVVPGAIYRYDRYVSATVSAGLTNGYTLGDGIAALDQVSKQVLPAGIDTSLAGEARDFADSSSSLLFAFFLALLVVYLVLAAQFESFIDPLIILLTVPLSLGGAILALAWTGSSLNIFSQIGIIMLVGLVTKNGILIVEFANQRRDEGLDKIAAVVDAAVERFRPIMMTSLATILGVLPIALSLGASAGSRQSLGIAVVGGLIGATLLSLYLVPALYSYLSRTTRSQGTDEPKLAEPEGALATQG